MIIVKTQSREEFLCTVQSSSYCGLYSRHDSFSFPDKCQISLPRLFLVNHAERMVIGGYLDVFALLITPEEGSEICGGCEIHSVS